MPAPQEDSDPDNSAPRSHSRASTRHVPGGFDQSAQDEEPEDRLMYPEPEEGVDRGGDVGGGGGGGDDPGDNGNGNGDNESDSERSAARNTRQREATQNLPPQDRVLFELLSGIANSLATHNRQASQPPAPVPAKTPKVAIKEPSTFNGKDPFKLNEFIFQCRIYFDANPHHFPTDHTKVSFALSYLTGNAQTWFQTLLEDAADWNAILWYNDWDLFVEELTSNFGAVDPLAEAAEEIEHLRMAATDHVNKYNVAFARLAGRLHWPDSVLVYRYYRGLPERIQDALSSLPTGKPATMREMREQVMRIDNRYWEQRERNRAAKSNPSKDTLQQQQKGKGKAPNPGNSANSNTQSNSNSTPNSNAKSGKTPNPSSTSQSTSSSSTSSNPLANVLGKNGKLTPAERQRRKDKNLCMFCGGSGHVADSCPKKTTPKSDNANKPKARSATTEAASSSTAGTSEN